MRVLQFYKTSILDSTGGIEQAINQIAIGVQKFGIQTDILSLSSSKDRRTTTINGYTTHRAKLNFELASTGFSFEVFSRFRNLINQVDIVHYHYPWPFMDLVHFTTRFINFFSRRNPIPTIVTYHSDILRQKYYLKLYRPLQFCFLRDINHIVTDSPNYLESSHVLQKYKRKYPDKLSVISLGLNKESYPKPSNEKLEDWRAKISAMQNYSNAKFFVFVGVMRYYKGLHILLAAMSSDISVTPYHLIIVGTGPLEAQLKTQATQLGLLKNVHFLGYLTDIDKVAILQLSYAVVFPSHLRSEAFGISLLEGAMYGKAMISSEIGTGTTFINIANETGLVVPANNPIALRHAMDYLWQHPEETMNMGHRAKERYWKIFTADRMAASYAQLYEKIAIKRL